MKFIPKNCFVSKKALHASLHSAYWGAVLGLFMGYTTLSGYKKTGKFCYRGICSYGTDAALQAYGVFIAGSLLALYALYFTICAKIYLKQNNFLLNSKKLNFFACEKCKKALTKEDTIDGLCQICGSEVVDLKTFIRKNPQLEEEMDFSLLPMPEEIGSTWDTTVFIFSLLFSLILISYVCWAYFSDLIVL